MVQHTNDKRSYDKRAFVIIRHKRIIFEALDLSSMMTQLTLYARYLCSRDALGLKAWQPVGQARRATIGYLVYNK